MKCQYLSDCDPGERYPKECNRIADKNVKFVYRHGEKTEVKQFCAEHAEDEVRSMNRWGSTYGHSAKMK